MQTRIARFFALVSAALAYPCLPAPAQDSPALFKLLVTFDYPESSLTIPHGINQRGDVAGEFTDITGAHGFVRYREGTFSPPITHPNDRDGETFTFDLNRKAVVGLFFDLTTFTSHSFVFVHGDFVDLDMPGAVSTQVIGLNWSNDYCGSFDDDSGVTRAFASIAGNLEELEIPGATLTTANAINDLGAITGIYQLGSTNNRGFVRDSSGTFTFPIDYPGATSTTTRGINSDGSVVGSYIDPQAVQHGFLFRPPNSFVSYTYPASTLTSLEGINDHDQICGQYKDADGQRHGFILKLR